MKMSSRKFAVNLRSCVFGLLLVAFVALTLSLAPTVYHFKRSGRSEAFNQLD